MHTVKDELAVIFIYQFNKKKHVKHSIPIHNQHPSTLTALVPVPLPLLQALASVPVLQPDSAFPVCDHVATAIEAAYGHAISLPPFADVGSASYDDCWFAAKLARVVPELLVAPLSRSSARLGHASLRFRPGRWDPLGFDRRSCKRTCFPAPGRFPYSCSGCSTIHRSDCACRSSRHRPAPTCNSW